MMGVLAALALGPAVSGAAWATARLRPKAAQPAILQTTVLMRSSHWLAPCIIARGARLQRMPELPDISAYLSALQERVVGQPLQRVRLNSPFLLRTAAPPISEAGGHRVTELRRI